MNAAAEMQAGLLRLTDPVILPDYAIAVGMTLVPGAGTRVGTAGPTGFAHYSPAQARRLAGELASSPEAGALKPAINALYDVADKIDEFRLSTPKGQA